MPPPLGEVDLGHRPKDGEGNSVAAEIHPLSQRLRAASSPRGRAKSFVHIAGHGFRCSRAIIRAAISAGETPEILDAWPRFRGRMAVSFCRASSRKPARAL